MELDLWNRAGGREGLDSEAGLGTTARPELDRGGARPGGQETGGGVAAPRAQPSGRPPPRACARAHEAEMASRGRASGRRAEVGVRAEVAG